MQKTKRLKYIDIARGISMFIIVFSHALSTTAHAYPVYRFLFFINVPIFFVLSGFTFRVKADESFWHFLKNKFFRIMLPYFVWGLVFLIPYFAFGGDVANQLSQNSSFDFWTQVGNTFYGNGANNALKQNGPLWFLPALFATELLFYFVVRFVKKWQAQVLVFASSITVGFLCTFFVNKVYLPWGLNSALTIGCFFYFGYLIREWKIIEKISLKMDILASIVCLLAGIVAVIFNDNLNVVWADYLYRNYFLTILSGLAFSWIILEISRLINKNKLMEFVGVNTMAILIFHKIVIVIAQTKLGGFSEMLSNGGLWTELLLTFVVSVVATALSALIGMLIRKILPELIGEKRGILRN